MPDPVSDPSYWSQRYARDETGWDLGGPCPVFVDLLDSPRAPPRGRVAFPGAGRGHDVKYFRERGYDAVGFDFAVQSSDPPIERLDVFDLARHYPAAFDVIVDYTCYCAIDPLRRREYVKVLRDALRPGGRLVALLFPVEERDGGPPFGIDESEIENVLARDLALVSVETPTTSVEPRLGRERLVILERR